MFDTAIVSPSMDNKNHQNVAIFLGIKRRLRDFNDVLCTWRFSQEKLSVLKVELLLLVSPKIGIQ